MFEILSFLNFVACSTKWQFKIMTFIRTHLFRTTGGRCWCSEIWNSNSKSRAFYYVLIFTKMGFCYYRAIFSQNNLVRPAQVCQRWRPLWNPCTRLASTSPSLTTSESNPRTEGCWVVNSFIRIHNWVRIQKPVATYDLVRYDRKAACPNLFADCHIFFLNLTVL
jgi:hypothetical protein